MFKYIYLDCNKPQNSEDAIEGGLCECGADNFLEVGDPVITDLGFKGTITSIVKGPLPVKVSGQCKGFNTDHLILDRYKYDENLFNWFYSE